jgi:hypothetical protein
LAFHHLKVKHQILKKRKAAQDDATPSAKRRHLDVAGAAASVSSAGASGASPSIPAHNESFQVQLLRNRVTYLARQLEGLEPRLPLTTTRVLPDSIELCPFLPRENGPYPAFIYWEHILLSYISMARRYGLSIVDDTRRVLHQCPWEDHQHAPSGLAQLPRGAARLRA